MEYNITYRQKDKGWQYIISRKENGKWRQIKSKQGFKTKNSDAKPASEEMLKIIKREDLTRKDIINNDYISITFKELFELFIDHNKLYKEQNTILTYENAKSAFKELWEMKIIDIKKIHIQKVVDTCTQRNMKRSTIELHLSKVKLSLNYYKDSYDNSYLSPIKNILLPKQISKEKKAITKKELDELLNQIKKTEESIYYIAAFIAGYCGLRIGEILGLTWNDVNETEMLLDINKQWKIDKNGDENFGELKSKNAYRNIPLPAKVLDALKKYQKTSITDINKRIIVAKPTTFISRIDEIMNKYKNISIHELRHTYATLLISNGIDFKTVAKFLGHDVAETIKTYSHVNDDMLKNATEKIKNIF
jgi:integrase